MAHTNNSINYIELPVDDIAATKAFYEAAFGWRFTDYGPGYTAFDGAGVDGGFNKAAAASSGCGVLVVLYHRDIEAMQAKVESLGARILQPIYEFPGGRRFHFTDPSGNELALWCE